MGGLCPRIRNSPKSISTARAVNKKTTHSRRRRRQVQYLTNVFGVRWKWEYFPLLQERQKWFHPRRKLTVGDTVIVADKSTPRSIWAIGPIKDFFLGKNGFLRHFKVKIKTSTLEQPITKLWFLESVGHWKWFFYFSELFKRLCATHWAFVMFYKTGHSSLFEALRPLWHLLLKEFIVWVVYCLM